MTQKYDDVVVTIGERFLYEDLQCKILVEIVSFSSTYPEAVCRQIFTSDPGGWRLGMTRQITLNSWKKLEGQQAPISKS